MRVNLEVKLLESVDEKRHEDAGLLFGGCLDAEGPDDYIIIRDEVVEMLVDRRGDGLVKQLNRIRPYYGLVCSFTDH
jgi:hypothetical protein